MKIINKQFPWVLIITILLCSCEEFTDVPLPQSEIVGTVIFEDTATANAALADIYARIRDNGVSSGSLISVTQFMGLYSDELTLYGAGAEFSEIYSHGVTPSNTLLNMLWSSAYSEIYATNAFIEGIENSQNITGEVRNNFLGEALFLRSYLHFYLANLYGNVPYITTTDYRANTQATRLLYSEVMNRIVEDLLTAKELLPDSYPTNERVRANKAVAIALLARVYVYTEEWQLANENANAVINNPAYTWEPNPNLVFLKDNPGIIWALSSGEPGANTLDADSFIFEFGPPPISSLSENLLNAFEPSDLRKELWISTVSDGAEEWYHAYKYKQQFPTASSEEYSIMFRLAEQYLIRAEARVHMGNIEGAKSDMNKVRTRAGLPNAVASSPPELLTAILRERRFELFTEQGHRWFDLKRSGHAPSVLSPLKPGWTNNDILLPIPETELLLNNNLLPQNPGY